jgi:hypothetical protein
MNILPSILKPEHKAVGLYLEEDDHLVYLKDKDGKVLAYWSASGVTIAEIQHEADQQLEWSKAGIAFEHNPEIHRN